MIKNYFETRRQFPRLKTEINAIAISDSGLEFHVIIQDISPDGAQITYHAKDGKLLFEKSANSSVLKKLKIALLFNLPNSKHEKIKLDTHPVHHHHLGNNMYVVGLFFSEDFSSQKNIIMNYLNSETVPSNDDLINFFGAKDSDKVLRKSNKEKVSSETENKEGISVDSMSISKNEFKQELMKTNTLLNSLATSIKMIEEKLNRIERKISK